MRWAILILLFSWMQVPTIGTAEIVIADFEGNSYGDWTVKGIAFGDAPPRGTLSGQQEVTGYRGNGLVNTFVNVAAKFRKLDIWSLKSIWHADAP